MLAYEDPDHVIVLLDGELQVLNVEEKYKLFTVGASMNIDDLRELFGLDTDDKIQYFIDSTCHRDVRMLLSNKEIYDKATIEEMVVVIMDSIVDKTFEKELRKYNDDVYKDCINTAKRVFSATDVVICVSYGMHGYGIYAFYSISEAHAIKYLGKDWPTALDSINQLEANMSS